MPLFYTLDEDRNPVPCKDTVSWAQWMKAYPHRKIARTVDAWGRYVSTVYLGINHSFGGGPPVLWETMAFGFGGDEYQERYTSEEEARAGHRRVVALFFPDLSEE